MSRSGSTLTALPHPERTHGVLPGLRFWGIAIGVALLLVGLMSPWLVTTGAGTTMNVMDLAEWLSLHPAVRTESPPLFSALSLRSVLIWSSLTWVLVWDSRWLRVAGIVLLAAAMLPPVEFVSNPGDANYGQMFVLAIVILLASTVVVFAQRRLGNRWVLRLAIGGLMLLSTAYGVWRGVDLMSGLSIDVGLGTGVFCYVLGVVVLLALSQPASLSRIKNGTLR